ncbi:MAG: hypothetical protein WCP20_09725 [Desulfuromonadales bacterium]
MTTRFSDPVVDEVRAIRKGIIQDCAEKHEDYYSHLIALQEHYHGRTVSFAAKSDSEQRSLAKSDCHTSV